MSIQRFAVELKRRTVGIAVRLADGFVFYASDKRFEKLTGRTFARIRDIERQIQRLCAGQPRAIGRRSQASLLA